MFYSSDMIIIPEDLWGAKTQWKIASQFQLIMYKSATKKCTFASKWSTNERVVPKKRYKKHAYPLNYTVTVIQWWLTNG